MADTTPWWFLVCCFIAVMTLLVVLEYIKFKKSPESTHYGFWAPKKERK